MLKRYCILCPCTLCVLFISAAPAADREKAAADIILVAAAADTPPGTPVIRVVREKLWGKYYPMVSTTFPNLPEFTCDSWCYESPVEFVDARPLDHGVVEMRHRETAHPNRVIITTITPERGAVEFDARMVLENKEAEYPNRPIGLNLCWQLRHAPGFASAPDSYPDFVRRCFLFTPEGRQFLLDLDRKTIPVKPDDHEHNNPPWVQMYVGTWQQIPARSDQAWADYSADRYRSTIIGVVSRDNRYLTAIANDSAGNMCQAWHDCMHNNPQWLPADAPAEQQRWRVKIYAMENDPDMLLRRVRADFANTRENHQEAANSQIQ